MPTFIRTPSAVIALLLVVSSALPSSAAAQDRPIGSFSRIAARVPEGRRVIVVDVDGREITGNLAGATPAALDLNIAGHLKTLAAEQVWEVRKRGDDVWNGALAGFSVAATFSGLLLADCGECEGRWGFVIGNGLAWGAIGALIDAVHVGQTTVFRAGSKPMQGRPQVRLAPGGAVVRWTISR
jgi:hypothetical protein